MKREDLETSGESLVRYKKEPSGCPVCGKVRPRLGAGTWWTQLVVSGGLSAPPAENAGETLRVQTGNGVS